MSSGLSVGEIEALLSYDVMNFWRWVAHGSALVERDAMSDAELKRILSHFAARIFWSEGVLTKEKRRAWLLRWVVRRGLAKVEAKLKSYLIWDDVQVLAQELAITLGERNSEGLSDIRYFSRVILTVSPRLNPKEVARINEERVLGRSRNSEFVG